MTIDGIGRGWRAGREGGVIDVGDHEDGSIQSGATTVPATSAANRSPAARSE